MEWLFTESDDIINLDKVLMLHTNEDAINVWASLSNAYAKDVLIFQGICRGDAVRFLESLYDELTEQVCQPNSDQCNPLETDQCTHGSL
jgi:hypothetical protein